MLVDTDVIIWFMRGSKKAKSTLDNLKDYTNSTITYMEILQGIRNKTELRLWKRYLKERNVLQIPLTPEITSRAMYWMEEYVLSHNLRMADALIAATASIHGSTLLTGNYLDYQFLPSLSLKVFKD